jgi:hypothetical protein
MWGEAPCVAPSTRFWHTHTTNNAFCSSFFANEKCAFFKEGALEIVAHCYESLKAAIISVSTPIYWSRGSRAGIPTAYWLDGDRVPSGSRIFSTSPRPALGATQPPIQRVPWALSLGVKRPSLESDHLPPNSSETKKTGINTSTPPPIRLHGLVLNWLNTETILPFYRTRPWGLLSL